MESMEKFMFGYIDQHYIDMYILPHNMIECKYLYLNPDYLLHYNFQKD